MLLLSKCWWNGNPISTQDYPPSVVCNLSASRDLRRCMWLDFFPFKIRNYEHKDWFFLWLNKTSSLMSRNLLFLLANERERVRLFGFYFKICMKRHHKKWDEKRKGLKENGKISTVLLSNNVFLRILNAVFSSSSSSSKTVTRIEPTDSKMEWIFFLLLRKKLFASIQISWFVVVQAFMLCFWSKIKLCHHQYWSHCLLYENETDASIEFSFVYEYIVKKIHYHKYRNVPFEKNGLINYKLF